MSFAKKNSLYRDSGHCAKDVTLPDGKKETKGYHQEVRGRRRRRKGT